jgi:Staphylococcal nuclease homologue
MGGFRGGNVGTIQLAATCMALAGMTAASSALAQTSACRLTDIGSATVRAASDSDLTLDDGRIVRLSGLENLAENATLTIVGQQITLKRIATVAETDRYGRIQAQVFLSRQGMELGAQRWFQADLLSQGKARLGARVGDPACAAELRVYESSARAAKLGLWADPVYVMTKAEDPAEVLERRGRLALVEGTVLSVRESGGTIYVNFGRRWTEDFTVTIAKRNERSFTAAGLEPRRLQGLRVRVRGWIEQRGGPWVEAARPEQIEIIGRN